MSSNLDDSRARETTIGHACEWRIANETLSDRTKHTWSWQLEPCAAQGTRCNLKRRCCKAFGKGAVGALAYRRRQHVLRLFCRRRGKSSRALATGRLSDNQDQRNRH